MKFKCPICGNEEVIEDKNHKFHCSFCDKTFSKEDLASLEKENKEFHDRYYKIIEEMYISSDENYKKYVEEEREKRILEEEQRKKEELKNNEKNTTNSSSNSNFDSESSNCNSSLSFKEVLKEAGRKIKHTVKKVGNYLKENLF
ncbi:MAG: hypothetical protein SPI36_05280 [Candidatus Onthovivens sp.]|nr:hypothetical protein [Bacilli bacterium]MDD7592495.1 hypothetical protein [Bacilli bacterium]MDY6058630.1 hypothetical protein [Candidatus Onthovivens sp.]